MNFRLLELGKCKDWHNGNPRVVKSYCVFKIVFCPFFLSGGNP